MIDVLPIAKSAVIVNRRRWATVKATEAQSTFFLYPLRLAVLQGNGSERALSSAQPAADTFFPVQPEVFRFADAVVIRLGCRRHDARHLIRQAVPLFAAHYLLYNGTSLCLAVFFGEVVALGIFQGRIVKLSATPLRNRPHMVFCSQGTSWGAGSTHGTSVGCNPLAYP